MRKPSPATVIATVALFVALGGAGIAADGQGLILGQSNSATSNTSLSAPVAGGKTLQLTNDDTSNPASNALGLTVAPNHAPFTVNTGVKVTNLNADRLDGFDSTVFMQGNAHYYSAKEVSMPVRSQEIALLPVPGVGTIGAFCWDSNSNGHAEPFVQISYLASVSKKGVWTASSGPGIFTTDTSGDPLGPGEDHAQDQRILVVVGGNLASLHVVLLGRSDGTCFFAAEATVS